MMQDYKRVVLNHEVHEMYFIHCQAKTKIAYDIFTNLFYVAVHWIYLY